MSASRSVSKVMMLASYPSASRPLQGARESRGERAGRGATPGGTVTLRPGIANPIVLSLGPWTPALHGGEVAPPARNPLLVGGGSDGEDPVCDQLRL